MLISNISEYIHTVLSVGFGETKPAWHQTQLFGSMIATMFSESFFQSFTYL